VYVAVCISIFVAGYVADYFVCVTGCADMCQIFFCWSVRCSALRVATFVAVNVAGYFAVCVTVCADVCHFGAGVCVAVCIAIFVADCVGLFCSMCRRCVMGWLQLVGSIRL